uniref:Uncharacterized protein LOC110223709 n=1 Tax=Phascolarctos cinereus TaxID=38626 RepID=A0A6P5M968_PHACI|nr:uncharacterized protein LOC110223709 [Phascolarctos cinereus]
MTVVGNPCLNHSPVDWPKASFSLDQAEQVQLFWEPDQDWARVNRGTRALLVLGKPGRTCGPRLQAHPAPSPWQVHPPRVPLPACGQGDVEPSSVSMGPRVRHGVRKDRRDSHSLESGQGQEKGLETPGQEGKVRLCPSPVPQAASVNSPQLAYLPPPLFAFGEAHCKAGGWEQDACREPRAGGGGSESRSQESHSTPTREKETVATAEDGKYAVLGWGR